MEKLERQPTAGNDEIGGPVIHFPTEAEARADIAAALSRMRAQRHEQRLAAVNALEALPRLIEVMKARSGQPYKIRRLLYSLWSGTAGADLSDLLCLDWQIRQDLGRVLLGWGFEDGNTKFFYAALETALKDAGLMEWFREEGGAV